MNIIDEFNLDEENFIWQDMAMCHDIPTDAFFDDAESNPAVESAVKAVCSYCPVREMCLQTAKDQKAQGIHGGEKLLRGNIVRR